MTAQGGHSSEARPSQLVSADVFRAAATVLVVVIHTSYWPPRAAVFDTLGLLSRLAVPAFMVLTGVLLSYRYGGRPPRAGVFLRRRFARSLLPWVAWAPVYTVFGWFLTGDPRQSVGGIVDYVVWGAGHLWFLLLIPQMYLAYLVWPRRHLWWWAAAAMAVQTALCVYRLFGPLPPGAPEHLVLDHGFQLLPFWVGYFAVGVAAGRSLAGRAEPDRLRPRPLAAAALAAVLSGWLLVGLTYGGAPHGGFQQGTGAFLLPHEPLFVLSVAALVWLVARPVTARSRALAATIRVLSDNSLGIYILHPMIIFEIGKHIGGLLDPGLPLSLVGFAVLTVGGLAAATVVSALLAAGPLAATIGSRRRRAATSSLGAQSSGSSAG